MSNNHDAGAGGPNWGTGARDIDGTDVIPVAHRSGAEIDGDGSVTSVVIKALAEAEGASPTEMAEPLYEYVDPDALDRLFATGHDASGRVVFSYRDYSVTVTIDEDVYVYVYTDG